MKIIRKFFSWTFTYKTLALLESVYSYLKDYYFISDTLYSQEFKTVIKRYANLDLSKDWLGRLYGIINPNIDSNGNYDFSNNIFEIDGANTNNEEFVKNLLYGKLDLINRQFHINKLYDYITLDIEHVGPVYADNFLVVIDIATRKYMGQCFKKWLSMGIIYGIIAIIALFIIL